MVSVMLYPCILCGSLLMNLFVLCVAYLTVFVNCLVKRFHRLCLCFCMSEVISSFKSLRARSQVFALLMLFLCVICILCGRVRACSCYASCPLLCCACHYDVCKFMLAVCKLVVMVV